MDGKLSTDDPVSKYVRDVPKKNQGITIYNLLTHTSGLSQADMEFPPADEPWAVATATMSVEPKYKPGEHWEYNNAGYFTLAAIIEKASGQKYGEYLKQHILTPAGMTGSGVMGQPGFDPARVTDRMGEDGRVRGNAAKWPYPVVWGYCGAGGIVSQRRRHAEMGPRPPHRVRPELQGEGKILHRLQESLRLWMGGRADAAGPRRLPQRRGRRVRDLVHRAGSTATP